MDRSRVHCVCIVHASGTKEYIRIQLHKRQANDGQIFNGGHSTQLEKSI